VDRPRLYLSLFIKNKILSRNNGAVERNNLEPSELHDLLSELEDWADVLKGEPELIHKLDEFARAAKPAVSPTRSRTDQVKANAPKRSGPSL